MCRVDPRTLRVSVKKIQPMGFLPTAGCRPCWEQRHKDVVPAVVEGSPALLKFLFAQPEELRPAFLCFFNAAAITAGLDFMAAYTVEPLTGQTLVWPRSSLGEALRKAEDAIPVFATLGVSSVNYIFSGRSISPANPPAPPCQATVLLDPGDKDEATRAFLEAAKGKFKVMAKAASWTDPHGASIYLEPPAGEPSWEDAANASVLRAVMVFFEPGEYEAMLLWREPGAGRNALAVLATGKRAEEITALAAETWRGLGAETLTLSFTDSQVAFHKGVPGAARRVRV